MGKKKAPIANQQDVYKRTTTAYDQTQKPSETENQMAGVTNQFQSAYNEALPRQMADYSGIMKGYQDFGKNARFSFNPVSAERPKELDEAYGHLREAAPGYREFASTGGYSPTDIQDLRARGVAPIRSAYGNHMMELDRARTLGGNGGAPNYIAAASRAQRELPGQIADATSNVNAGLADSIRQGKLAGLAGITGIGSEMGGLSSAEAGRKLTADMNNQGADIQTQGMTSNAKLAGMGGEASLYGTSPGMATAFGNQALNAWQTRAGMEQSRNQFGLNLLDAQMRTSQLPQKTPWWKTALSVAGTVAPYAAMAFSSRELKEDIKPVKNVSKFSKHLKDLPLYTWKYKGDKVTHFGPIAEEFKEKMGIGDGKTLHLADVMGVILASQKEQLANA